MAKKITSSYTVSECRVRSTGKLMFGEKSSMVMLNGVPQTGFITRLEALAKCLALNSGTATKKKKAA